MPPKISLGLIQGRFQIIHKGHLEYFEAAKKRCETVIVGITDHDPERSYFDYALYKNNDPQKPFRTVNEPFHTFTYYERLLMIKAALEELGIPEKDFVIVPLPIHKPHLIKYYIPTGTTVFVTIYENWGHEKKQLFEALGYETNVLWERPLSQRFTTGTEVRRRLASGTDWELLVPNSVAQVIRKLGLDNTLKGL